MIKIKKIMSIIVSILTILILNILVLENTVNAASLSSANLFFAGDCEQLLKYNGVPVKVTYVKYYNGDNSYPAYCLNKNLPGVTSDIEYSVSANDAISDVGLWRVIVNGYPYKSVSELGCQTETESFTATKQSVYCYIHGNDINAYEPIGEAGQRTLNAMHLIINSAQNSSETPQDNMITINSNESEWKQDDINKNYLSKTYSLNNAKGISTYKIDLLDVDEDLKDEIKVANYKNEEINEFKINEFFKILIPIEKLIKDGDFKIDAKAYVMTKPVLYGVSPDSNYQDYALTCATYEEGMGNSRDYYNKNDTEIKVLKKDEENNKLLEGVEFQLINENKKNVYNKKTDKNGEIVFKNLIPGKYYLKEIHTIDGYNINNQEIEIDVGLNEKKEVTVYNAKIKVSTQDVPVVKEVKKLPVTGR